MPFGGKFRLIDIPISNSLHAGIDRIFVITQFNSASLHRHIAQTYRFSAFSLGYVNILAAELTAERKDWYQGTADAVRQCLPRLLEPNGRPKFDLQFYAVNKLGEFGAASLYPTRYAAHDGSQGGLRDAAFLYQRQT